MKDGYFTSESFGILDHVPLGVFILRKDFVVLFWNSCLEDWTGIARNRITGSNICTYFPHLATPRYSSRLHDIFEGGPPTIFSSQLHHSIIPSSLPHDRTRIQHTVITSIKGPDSSGYCALFAIQDVTDLTSRIQDYRTMRDQAIDEIKERKKAEAELLRTQESLEMRVKERTFDLERLAEQLQGEVHERKKAEEELKKLVSTLNTLIDHIPEGALLIDSDFRIILSNSIGERYLKILNAGSIGDLLTELAGLSVNELFSGTEHNRVREIEINGQSKSIFQIGGSRIGSPESPKGMVVVIKDITEERDLEERIHARERLAAVGQLAAGIAHDFNNILTGIIGLADILLSDNSFAEEEKKMVEAILHNGLRAAHLIRQILDFSRKSINEMRSVEMVAFLTDFTRFIKRTIPESVHISVSYEPGDYYVYADPTKLQQVLANISLNARDAMPDGGTLRFELSHVTVRHSERPPIPDMHAGDWIILAISDTGTGMMPDVFSHIFEPFFTTKEPGKGTGLGLSQVYGIIKQHEGFLDVKTDLGKGSTFYIALPVSKPARTGPEQLHVAPMLKGDSETILVVEDDETVRNLLVRSLRRLNFIVETSTNGKDALKMFGDMQDTIRLVITDLIMPEMGGIELSRMIRVKKPDMKIIALTGYPLGSEKDNIMRAGIAECIKKPFQIQTLVDAVFTALGKNPL